MKARPKKENQSLRLQFARMLNRPPDSSRKLSKGDTIALISTLVNIALSILLVYIGVKQFAISEDQTRISSTQTEIARQQFQLEKALSHTGFEPYVDCDLVYPAPVEKTDAFIHIINKSPVAVESVMVDGYAIPFDEAGKASAAIQRRTYPGHLFFKDNMKPYEYAKTSVMKVPPPGFRPKDIVKVFYVFDLTYLRNGDLARFKNRVAFELHEDNEVRIQRIPNLKTHPYNDEINKSIRSQKEIVPPETPESFLKY